MKPDRAASRTSRPHTLPRGAEIARNPEDLTAPRSARHRHFFDESADTPPRSLAARRAP
jgi:hypothetical protein